MPPASPPRAAAAALTFDRARDAASHEQDGVPPGQRRGGSQHAPATNPYAVTMRSSLAWFGMLLLLVSCASHLEAVQFARAPEAQPRPVLAAEVAAPAPVSSAAPQVAPTWSTIYDRYLAAKTDGGCGRSHACHADEMADAASTYSWLQQRGYISGSRSPLASTTNSCLGWFGGNMPPKGKANPQAAEEISAWVAAGARDN